MSPTQGQAEIIKGNPIPAISKNLKAFLYGWLPLSDAYRHLLIAEGHDQNKGNDMGFDL